MSYTFKNLADIELLNEVPEDATKIIETGGTIKRVPNKESSGGGGVKTAHIKQIYTKLAPTSTYSSSVVPAEYMTFECSNMTFDEVLECLQNEEPVACFVTAFHGESEYLYRINRYGTIIWEYGNTEHITIQYIDPFYGSPTQIYWESDGQITTNNDYTG